MLEQATLLVTSYNAMIMVAIAAIGIVTATVWTVTVKQRKAGEKSRQG